ncbi:ComEC/Rec2 family competence protein [Hyalangium versicolor]|uniref:ComEC/Rec2 family competence protein n=1 Tax=Hyalangium versicolor TaxID=2861190 RepID=UPI001CCAB9A3|nr:MBL fold metallo-hydrolase [Hyalangium versicolor]
MTARLLPLLGLLLVAACKQQPPPAAPPSPARANPEKHFLGSAPDGKLHVYFLDVGQGDSALIVSPEGRTVLVDAGPASAVKHLINRLPELLAARLDTVVLTHPAPDHYGALDVVQKITDPVQLIEPQLPENPSEYDGLLTTMGSRQVAIFSPAPNPAKPQELTRIPLGKDVELTVLWPRAPTEPLLTVSSAGDAKSAQHEANSIVLRLTYGKTSVLFAGDARAETEAALMKAGVELSSTVLKVGAHGADVATTEEFLQQVGPQAAIISVNAEAAKALGVPAPATIERLKAVSAHVFRTDENGEVHAVSDGEKFVLTPQKISAGESPSTQYVFSPDDKKLDPIVPLVPLTKAPAEESAKAVPAKGVSAKATQVDLSRFDKVVEVNSKGEERSSRTSKKAKETGDKYYASRHKPIFHKASCPSVKRINPENLVTYNSREEAMKQRKPAGDCRP